MKKVVSLLLVMMMVLGTQAALAQRDSFAGEWHLARLETKGMTVSPEEANVDIHFDLRDDGTGVLYKGEAYAEMHWLYYMDMVILGKGETAMSFTYAGGELTTELGGGKLVFSREGAAAQEAAQESPAIPNAAAEDFYGAWSAQFVTMNGVRVGIENLGMQISFVINETGVQYTAKGKSTAALPYEVDNGCLTFSISGKAMTLTRLEDGSLCAVAENLPDEHMHFGKTGN